MKKILISVGLAIMLPNVALAEVDVDYLDGDEGLACEAILCLSTGSPPSECTRSLRRYFSIDHKRPDKMISRRIDFLKLCPASSIDFNMSSLVDAIGNGAGRCDTASLNRYLKQWGGDSFNLTISNQRPEWCAAYSNHVYTIVEESDDYPMYVGEPSRGGYWVNKSEYAAAKSDYDRRIAEEDARYNSEYGNWY